MYKNQSAPLVLSFTKQKTNKKPQDIRNLIPFYGDVNPTDITKASANEQDLYEPTIYIHAGDWFNNDITSAMRHYGFSMKEYPSGCILALKEIHNKKLYIWGCN